MLVIVVRIRHKDTWWTGHIFILQRGGDSARWQRASGEGDLDAITLGAVGAVVRFDGGPTQPEHMPGPVVDREPGRSP